MPAIVVAEFVMALFALGHVYLANKNQGLWSLRYTGPDN
jgi:hypothetical protein